MKSKLQNIVFMIFMGLLLLLGITFASRQMFHFHVPSGIRARFENYLTIKETLPLDCADALYILGGSERSTYRHIIRAASLFHSGKTYRILIFDSREKCHYEPDLGRNITRNELTIRLLVEKGIPKSCIDTIPVKEGFFGTLSEARALEMYLRDKSFNSVILVSSPCHSRRVEMSFRDKLKEAGVSMYIVSSEDPFSFSELILEPVKVLVYSTLL